MWFFIIIHPLSQIGNIFEIWFNFEITGFVPTVHPLHIGFCLGAIIKSVSGGDQKVDSNLRNACARICMRNVSLSSNLHVEGAESVSECGERAWEAKQSRINHMLTHYIHTHTESPRVLFSRAVNLSAGREQLHLRAAAAELLNQMCKVW